MVSLGKEGEFLDVLCEALGLQESRVVLTKVKSSKEQVVKSLTPREAAEYILALVVADEHGLDNVRNLALVPSDSLIVKADSLLSGPPFHIPVDREDHSSLRLSLRKCFGLELYSAFGREPAETEILEALEELIDSWEEVVK